MSISFELLSTSASQDEQFNYSYSITYLATVTDRTSEGAAEVLAAAPFTYGSSYAGTPFASAQVDTKDRLANGAVRIATPPASVWLSNRITTTPTTKTTRSCNHRRTASVPTRPRQRSLPMFLGSRWSIVPTIPSLKP